jgi:hypothetical protein
VKKSIALLFASACIIMGVVACGKKDTSMKEKSKVAPAGDLVEKLGANVQVLGIWLGPIKEEGTRTEQLTIEISADRLKMKKHCGQEKLQVDVTAESEAALDAETITVKVASEKSDTKTEGGETLACKIKIPVSAIRYEIKDNQLYFELGGKMELVGQEKIGEPEETLSADEAAKKLKADAEKEKKAKAGATEETEGTDGADEAEEVPTA